MRLAACVWLSVLLQFAGAQNAGVAGQNGAPKGDFGARDVFAEYALPRVKDGDSDALWRSVRSTQVLSRARTLGLDSRAAGAAWRGAGAMYDAARLRVMETHTEQAETIFNGTRASELNALLAEPGTRSVRVTSPELRIDKPVRIGRDGIQLDLGKTQLVKRVDGPYLLEISKAERVRVSGGVLRGQGWGVLVAGSRVVTLTGMEFDGLSGGGAVVTGSEAVTLWGNQFHGLYAAPIMLHGATEHAVIANNEITGNLGASNWHAGIVVSDRIADLAADPKSLLRDDNFGVKEQRIVERTKIPENNLIAYNHVGSNLASGIYSDGGSLNLYIGNRIDLNSKEGLCLDNGSTANVVAFNVFEGDGKRWGKTDDDLRRDFVFTLGRMPDGSSPAKLPAISVDNAAYNEVMFNEIDGNFGGGIKMVRTGFYNVIALNTLVNNNEGRSERFHFFGIEMGSAGADVKVPDLDFTPSCGNEVFGNTLRGTHYAGIFFAEGSDMNVVFDNTIFGATNWAMESVKAQPNESFNNLTNLKLRNIGAGLDPRLLKLGAGEFDAPPAPHAGVPGR